MKLSIAALLLIFVIYLLFFPAQTRPELTFQPAWAVDVAGVPASAAGQIEHASVFPFDLDSFFGYISYEGEVLLREEKLYGVAIDEKRYISYSSVSGNLIIQDRTGRVTANVEAPGYPVLLNDRLFIVSTNRAGVSELVAGERFGWEREYTSVITGFDAKGGLTAVGLLDSRVQILDGSGAVSLELDMKGSRINAVYGCALSEDGSRVAVVHGIDPQYLSIVEVAGESPEISDYSLETEFRTSRYLRFFGADRFLLIERADGMKILDLSDGTEYLIESAAPFLDAGNIQNENLIWAVFGNARAAELIIIEPPQKVLFRSGLTSAPSAISKNEHIMLGLGDTLCTLKKEIH